MSDSSMREDAFFAWDVLFGRQHRELGGPPELLDIVGANAHSIGQASTGGCSER